MRADVLEAVLSVTQELLAVAGVQGDYWCALCRVVAVLHQVFGPFGHFADAFQAAVVDVVILVIGTIITSGDDMFAGKCQGA